MKIYIANNAAALSALNVQATVEAEYGLDCVNGQILTLAHHGPRAGRPCPCSIPNLPELGIRSVGISHVDLDTIGGLMAIMGIKPVEYDWVRDFWRVASEIDVQGIHKLPTMDLGICPDMIMYSLNAFYAFSETEGRVFAPRDGSVVKVDLSRHFEIITTLLTRDKRWGWKSPARQALLEVGKVWAASKRLLSETSYIGTAGADVLVRSSEQFTAHLYWYNDRLHKAIVSFNPKTGSITVSCCDEIPGFHAGAFCQQVWGEGAGGHAGIGGSPRGQQLTLDEAKRVALLLAAALS